MERRRRPRSGARVQAAPDALTSLWGRYRSLGRFWKAQDAASASLMPAAPHAAVPAAAERRWGYRRRCRHGDALFKGFLDLSQRRSACAYKHKAHGCDLLLLPSADTTQHALAVASGTAWATEISRIAALERVPSSWAAFQFHPAPRAGCSP